MSESDDGGLPPGLPPLLGGLIQMEQEAHDRAHMSADQTRMELYAFLDSLSKEQLLSLRLVLNLPHRMIDAVDGMVIAHLRLIHKVDPESGEDLLVT